MIPGCIATASSIAQGKRETAAGRGGKGKSQVVRQRGFHTRNRYTRVAKADRLREEAAERKRARKEGSGGGGGDGGGGGSSGEEEGGGDGGGTGRYAGEMGASKITGVSMV